MPLEGPSRPHLDDPAPLLAALGSLLALVAPPLCWACRGASPSGEPLCRDCRARLSWLGPDRVRLCGVEVWAPLAYEGPARELVKGLKFHGAVALAEAMAARIAANAPRGLLERCVLVPVPASRARTRTRGFNQAALLAYALAERRTLAVLDCLERSGRPAPQVGRPRHVRLRAVGGSVVVRPGSRVPSAALLVDDVVTTGATLAACADALRGGGAREVSAVAYARTPGR